jgi:hypothetical protein
MKRGTSKKPAERRKSARSSARTKGKKPARAHAAKSPVQQVDPEACHNCAADLSGGERALFVEEEIGRIFCSEACIAGYFSPEIEKLEKEYFKRLSSNDLNGDERESLAHLRWITLQEPDEVWREKTLSGDFRYTLISEFQPNAKKVWSICICLFLRGEPSFLYLAFPTRNQAMVNHYRRGERVELPAKEPGSENRKNGDVAHGPGQSAEDSAPAQVDRLADAWTEDETFRAQSQLRSSPDIPTEEYPLYQSCLEETLENPHEVWTLEGGLDSEEGADGEEAAPAKAETGAQGQGAEVLRIYHFIRQYTEESPSYWYVIIARETEDEEEIEILDAFPTRDASLVDRYRRGSQELGKSEPKASQRLVH